jgi:small GTP-binding protein
MSNMPASNVDGRSKDAMNVLIVGVTSVGKTSIQKRILFDQFNEDEQPTYWYSSNFKSITEGSHQVQIELNDTIAIDSQDYWVPENIFEETHLLMVVFDINNINTLSKAWDWLEQNKNKFKNSSKILFVGNKYEGTVDNQELDIIERIAEENKGEFFMASAKKNDGIDVITTRLTALAIDHKEEYSKTVGTHPEIPQTIANNREEMKYETDYNINEESKNYYYEGGDKEEDINEEEFESQDLFKTKSLLRDTVTVQSLMAKTRIEGGNYSFFV